MKNLETEMLLMIFPFLHEEKLFQAFQPTVRLLHTDSLDYNIVPHYVGQGGKCGVTAHVVDYNINEARITPQGLVAPEWAITTLKTSIALGLVGDHAHDRTLASQMLRLDMGHFLVIRTYRLCEIVSNRLFRKPIDIKIIPLTQEVWLQTIEALKSVEALGCVTSARHLVGEYKEVVERVALREVQEDVKEQLKDLLYKPPVPVAA
jgi:hypothetical protein